MREKENLRGSAGSGEKEGRLRVCKANIVSLWSDTLVSVQAAALSLVSEGFLLAAWASIFSSENKDHNST